MNYQSHKSIAELNQQLLIGIKKHLIIASDTTQSKHTRLESLGNIKEVLEYVITHMNEAIPEEELAILSVFVKKLLLKVSKAQVVIHTRPESFKDEIGFISVLLEIKTY